MKNNSQQNNNVFDAIKQMQNILESIKQANEKKEHINIKRLYDEQSKMLEIIKNEAKQMTSENISEMQREYSKFIRPSQLRKRNFDKRIKDGLGVGWTKDEVDRVKERFFFIVGIKKWQDIPDNEMTEKISILDECIEAVKKGRDYQQTNMGL